MKSVVSIILAGGQGKRLFPLTLNTCKPALPFGGRYCLIDIPISNSLNSGIREIFVISQYFTSQLQQHLLHTYQMNAFYRIELLAAEERHSGHICFRGTADAVRHNLQYLSKSSAEYFLILSGDQLYTIDFHAMLEVAKRTDADLTIAALPVAAKEASRMGILKIESNLAVIDFQEKPANKKVLEPFRASDKLLVKAGAKKGSPKHYFGSMGIYIFKKQALLKLLQEDMREDFGMHLIPSKVKQGGVAAYLHDGYWEDIGTVESFYEANLALTHGKEGLNCYDDANPIRSLNQALPGARVFNSSICESILCDGALINAKEISNSIIGPRTVVDHGTVIRNSYIIGHDSYALDPTSSSHIGSHCVIEKAIIDKNCRIGAGVRLINQKKLKEYDSEHVYIRDGIIVVTRGAKIPDGYTL